MPLSDWVMSLEAIHQFPFSFLYSHKASLLYFFTFSHMQKYSPGLVKTLWCVIVEFPFKHWDHSVAFIILPCYIRNLLLTNQLDIFCIEISLDFYMNCPLLPYEAFINITEVYLCTLSYLSCLLPTPRAHYNVWKSRVWPCADLA